MSKFWKWILWILGILIVLGIIAIPFAMHFAFGLGPARGFTIWHGPMIQNHHGFGFDRFHGPMMYGRGFGLRGGIFSIFGGLVRLAFFGILLYGAYWLGKRNARVVLDSSTNSPTPTVAPLVEQESKPKSE
jgi:hypothetical protein